MGGVDWIDLAEDRSRCRAVVNTVPIAYGQEEEPIFIGKEIAQHKDYSEDTAKHIDRAVKSILEKARKRAEGILTAYKADVEKLADALMTRETLIDDEIRALLGLPAREAHGNL